MGRLQNLLWALLFIFGLNFAYADTPSKIAYLNVEFPSNDTSLYVGQDIAVKYSLTLLSQAKLVGVEFLDFSQKNNVDPQVGKRVAMESCKILMCIRLKVKMSSYPPCV